MKRNRILVCSLIVLVLTVSVVVMAQVNRPFRNGSVWSITTSVLSSESVDRVSNGGNRFFHEDGTTCNVHRTLGLGAGVIPSLRCAEKRDR